MENNTQIKEYLIFMLKCILIHTVTYFAAGIIFSNILNYKELFQTEVIRDYMKSYGDTGYLLGPFLQPLRGILFSIALWPLRKTILEKKFGWLVTWGLLFIIGIINTPAASPASIEGVLYSKIPLSYHLLGLPEVTLQTLAFSLLLFFWDKSCFLRLHGIEKKQKTSSLTVKALFQALTVSAFAYMGYAAAAILWLLLSGIPFDATTISASSALEQQLIFIVAFLFNTAALFLIRLKSNRLPLPLLFAGFILLDIIVPFLYSLLFFPQPFGIGFALLLGIIPGCVMAVGGMILLRATPKRE